MAKKIQRSKDKKKKINSALRITFIIFSVFVLFIGAIVLLLPRSEQNPLCANSISCAKDLSGEPSKDNEGVYFGRKVRSPEIPITESFAIAEAKRRILGDTTVNKRIYVDLTNQKLYAYEGDSVFMNVPVSTGKWNYTPTGDFWIWIWLRATRMSGGSGAGYYNLPNVPFTMYYYNSRTPKHWGYSLHGAYWHNNFGHPMSHGCVNMRIPDAEKLFYWSNPNIKGWTTYTTTEFPGPMITVYGTTPRE